MKRLIAIFGLTFLLAGCSEKMPEGVYVDITLENTGGKGNSYVVFNPNIKTIEECEASVEKALPSIMASAPAEIPRQARATGFKCYLEDPRES